MCNTNIWQSKYHRPTGNITVKSVKQTGFMRYLQPQQDVLNSDVIYTTTNFTRYSVTEVGALSAAGWAWSLHGKQT